MTKIGKLLEQGIHVTESEVWGKNMEFSFRENLRTSIRFILDCITLFLDSQWFVNTKLVNNPPPLVPTYKQGGKEGAETIRVVYKTSSIRSVK